MIELTSLTEHTPQPGELVVLYNGIRAWVTTWKPALAVCGQFPATHFAAVSLPYAPISRDRTRIRERDEYEFVRLARKEDR